VIWWSKRDRLPQAWRRAGESQHGKTQTPPSAMQRHQPLEELEVAFVLRVLRSLAPDHLVGRARGTALSQGPAPISGARASSSPANDRYCFPLTFNDHASRFLLLCEGSIQPAKILQLPRLAPVLRARPCPFAPTTNVRMGLRSDHVARRATLCSKRSSWRFSAAGRQSAWLDRRRRRRTGSSSS